MEEVTEDELNQSLEWDSRNFGEKHFLPDGDKYKVNFIFNFLNYFFKNTIFLKNRIFLKIFFVSHSVNIYVF